MKKYAASKCKTEATPPKAEPLKEETAPSLTSAAAIQLREQQTRAIFLRKNDARKQAADMYLTLMETYKNPDIGPESLQMPADLFFWMKVDDVLWAARYLALVGDYTRAQQFVEETRALLKGWDATKAQPADKTRYATTLADTYHTEAFRITTEQGNWALAAQQMDEASSIVGMDTEWKERIQWYQGFYRYLGGQLQEALPHWTSLLARVKAGDMHDKLTFWMMQLYQQQGNQKEANRLFSELKKLDAFNFYTVAAEQRMGKNPLPSSYMERFGTPEVLQKRLENKRKYAISAVVKNKKLKASLEKIELLLKADLPRFAKWAALDFAAELKKTLRCNSVHFECYLYLSRILYATGNYKAAIQITQQLAQANPKSWDKWPEQLLIAFPQAYFNLYQAQAAKNHVEITDLFALSRQESLFDETAESPAQAYGLMQLIAPTAIRVQGAPLADLKRLLQPELNIQIGSRYVQMLVQRYPGATKFPVYAAYNAGEYAVDRWVQKRQHQDPFVWVELIPFGETRKYVQNVWRNAMVYEHLYTPRGVETTSRLSSIK